MSVVRIHPAVPEKMSNKNIKPTKELPSGFTDRNEAELIIRDYVISKIRNVMISYGFEYLETPSFEFSESIGKFLPDKERPDEGIFSFEDDKKWLSLRYDLTAPLARYVAKNFQELPKPYKRYQLGTVWRNEKPGPGRFREFIQFDADFVGTRNLQADAELCIMISDILEACGLSKNDYIIKISSRKFIEKIFSKLKILDENQKSIVLRALDKIDRLGWVEVKKLLSKGRKDKSGDYTQGANLSDDKIKILEQSMENFDENLEDIIQLKKIFNLYDFKNFKFDSSIIRGLGYYTGIIFEVDLTFKVKNNKGQPIQFGSIGGGGRYDNLVSRFGNFDVPCTGVSIGIDRMIYALLQKEDLNKIKNNKPVMICVFNENSYSDYINILKYLRKSKINSEIYAGKGNIKKQFEYANKRKLPALILYGDEEMSEKKPKIRDLNSGKEVSVNLSELCNEIKKIL